MKLFKHSILYFVLLSIMFVLSSCESVSSYRGTHASDFSWSDWRNENFTCKTFYASHGDFAPNRIKDMVAAQEFCRTIEYNYYKEMEFVESGLTAGQVYSITCCKPK